MPRVESLSIQVLCHATEDIKKVIKAVENVLGSDAARKMSMSTEVLEGHYGDPITLIKIFVQDQKSSENAFLNILSKLSPIEREELWSERSKKGKHGGKLYLRLDKQSAFRGHVQPSDKDPIRLVVNVRGNVDIFRKRVEVKLTSKGDELKQGR